MTTITVLGATGFIGSHLVRRLDALGLAYEAPGRGEDLRGRDLGAVVDCAGVTAGFRERPLDVAESHVCLIERLLRGSRAESLTYLSSAGLYYGGASPAREEDAVRLAPADADYFYNVAKAMGEALTLSGHPRGRVVRLATVYGGRLRAEGFLSQVLREVVTKGETTLGMALESSRDYVNVHDAVGCLIDIAIGGRHPVYNVGSGHNVTNRQLAARLTELAGCRVRVAAGAPRIAYPPLDVERIREEFDFRGSDLLEDLPDLLRAYREEASGARGLDPEGFDRRA